MGKNRPGRKGRTGLIIALAVVGVLVVAAIVAGFLFLGRGTTSLAHEHLPEGCDAVMRVDLASLRSVEPIAQHVIPALDRAAREGKDAGKMTRFFVSAGLDPRKDLNELAICATDLASGPRVVVIVGGRMRPDGVIEALQKHEDDLRDIEIERVSKRGGRTVLETRSGAFIAQAADGALVVSNDAALLERALEPSQAYAESYRLPLDQQAIGVVSELAMTAVGKRVSTVPFARKIGDVGRSLVTIDLAERRAMLEIDMKSEEAAKQLTGALEDTLRLLRLAPAALGGLSLLTRAKFVTEGAKTVGRLDIPAAVIEDGAKEVARRIDKANE
jgi:hypothetical protein